MSMKIHCPICGRILGDTDAEIHGLRLNCRACKNTVNIDITKLPSRDYLGGSEEDANE